LQLNKVANRSKKGILFKSNMKKIIKVGINGFGRIGRNAARIILNRKDLILTAINSRSNVLSHAYLLKYDSNYGIFDKEVKVENNDLMAGKSRIKIFNSDDPFGIPWNKADVDIVIDATGKFRKKEELMSHLKNGVKYVVLSSPVKDETKTYVYGVNHTDFNPVTDKVISNSSCTTNCLATTLKVLIEKFGVVRANMTTVHAVTDSQNLLDNSHKKEVRLRRAAFMSMIPSQTGSAKDIVKLYPELNGKIVCQAIRVPLSTVSIILLTCEIKKNTTIEEINKVYTNYAKNKLKGILDVSADELVSKDYSGNSFSSILDPYLTKVIDGKMVSVSAWYDNEWGYTNRLVDMVSYISQKAK
jgi:glyceraldehyde 3-phosphate dehydrogenase